MRSKIILWWYTIFPTVKCELCGARKDRLDMHPARDGWFCNEEERDTFTKYRQQM